MGELTLVSAAVLLFLVMDPLGNVPMFIAALKNVAPERQRRVIMREMAIALGALFVFLAFGRAMLGGLGLSEASLGVAGGVILALIALRMIFPSPHQPLVEEVQAEPFIVPLAIPYVAGPSSLATVVLLMSREPARWLEWTAAVTLAWAACLPIVLASTWLRARLGERGLVAMERLMGLILVTIAVEMLLSGVLQFFAAHWPPG
jgi:multiple antibiotic resistance protein